MEWIRDHVVVFADDLHFRWIVHSPHTTLVALQDLDMLLCDLRAAGFRVNTQKSVAIMRLVEKQVLSFHRKWCSQPSSGPLLHLPNPDIQIPLVSKISYLGVILSYRAWENDTVQRRFKAAQTCFRILSSWTGIILCISDYACVASVSTPRSLAECLKWVSHIGVHSS